MTTSVGRTITYLPRLVRSAAARVLFHGTRRFCPVCGRSARAFQRFGVVPRSDARCPYCGSLERHRLLWRYLEQETTFFESAGTKMLHLAAERCFEPTFRKIVGSGYITADLLKPADVKMDITDIQFPDSSFDIVYCSHVLEHVPDDRRAMQELCRVLKPDGWAIVMVPITADKIVEDVTITDPQARERLFGKRDHVRRYGPDFADRLQEAGFTSKVVAAHDFLPADDITRIAVGSTKRPEYIWHCTKATESVGQRPATSPA